MRSKVKEKGAGNGSKGVAGNNGAGENNGNDSNGGKRIANHVHEGKSNGENGNGSPIIRLVDVWKVYTMGQIEVPALRGMNMDVRPSEFVAVMGPSGSGKSTAMNMIGCLDVPTKGEIYLTEKDISHLRESDLAQIRGRTIGFIFQQFNLINTLTALENVMLPMIFQDVPAYEREKKARELLELIGLGERMKHKPTELSGGQQQRVAIARALANDPQVILADEPTGNLDSKSGKDVMEVLSRLHEEKDKTIVMVTHDANLAVYADRIIKLIDGKVVDGG